MAMLSIIGLSISFVILVTILMWMMAYTKIGPDWLKSIILVIVMWYGLMVYFMPIKMMGWPVCGELPETGIILAWKAIDPGMNPGEGGIYLWMVPKEEYGPSWKDWLPNQLWMLKKRDIPRAYRIEYLPKSYEQLSDADKLVAGKEGNVMMWRKRTVGGESPYEVIKFEEIFKKETQNGRD